MKLLAFTLILTLSAIVSAQNTHQQRADEAAKVIAELSASIRGPIKNAPFSAEEVNESVQTLADGNRIVRSSTGKFYRNSEGRIRREGAAGIGGVLGTTFSFGQGVSIVNPTAGEKYLLDSKLQTARVIELAQGQKELAIAGARVSSEDAKREIERLKTQLFDKAAATATIQPVPPVASIAPIAPVAVTTLPGGFAYSVDAKGNSKYETRTEDLGSRDFEGVVAEGTRRTTIIPTDAIGNERPIEIVYERWFSKELGVVVFSRNSDPRFGEQTYQLKNIVRAEPDPSLFSVPTHYRRVESERALYKMTPAKKVQDKVSVKPATGNLNKMKQHFN